MALKVGRKIECDVLVIGSGAAGLRAAIEANGFGCYTVVVGKCRFGDAHTTLATGGINAALGTMDKQDMWEIHAADTLIEGGIINNPRMAELLCRYAEHAIHELISMGAEFARDKNGKLIQRFFGAHTYRRTCFSGDETGKEILRVLVEQVKKIGIPQHEHVYILRLLRKSSKVTGAIGFDIRTGKVILFSAKSVIIATGGYSRLYYRSSSRNFENTGDGCFLALENGCALMDMEMLQFHPTGMIWPKKAEGILVTEAVRGEGGKLFNARNERFMKSYHPRMELGPRDVVARAIYNEIEKGKGTEHGGVWLDITHRPKNYILERLPKMYRQFRKYLGKDISKDRMEVAPTAHYSMGGIAVDADTGKTGVQGLFAVGEVTAGTHGANRLGGNSLLECIVFGKLVGEHAAMDSKMAESNNVDAKEIKKSLREIGKFFAGKSSGNARQLKTKLQKIMWEHCGVIRSEKELGKGLKEIEGIKKEFRKIKVRNGLKENQDFVTAMDLHALIVLAEVVIKSALVRKESRGAHARSDFPQANDREWKANVYCRKKGNELRVLKRKVPELPGEIKTALKIAGRKRAEEKSADIGAEGMK